MATSTLTMTNGTTPATPAAGKSKLFMNTSKRPAVIDDAGVVVALSGGEGTAQSSPGDPTQNTGATAVMMGLAGSITPATTGRILFIVSGDCTDSSNTATVTIQLYYGTGSAPANQAAVTGNAIGGAMKFITAAAAQRAPFMVQAIVTGLTLGTAYWFDISIAGSAGNSKPQDISMTGMEI